MRAVVALAVALFGGLGMCRAGEAVPAVPLEEPHSDCVWKLEMPHNQGIRWSFMPDGKTLVVLRYTDDDVNVR